jgi:hypothetical protein
MSGSLSAEAYDRFQRDGLLFPVPALTQSETQSALARLETLEAAQGGALSPATRGKPHILLPWLSEIVRNERILDAVESLLGPDILCWSSSFFAKSPGDGSFVSWHQDSTYWGLSGNDVVTAWVAFTPSNTSNGCLRVIPGSHLGDQLPHRDSNAEGNMLSRGQEIAVEVDESKAVDIVLRPGEMSLHHVRIAHGSARNLGSARRVGFAIRYIPTSIRQLGGRTSALLVRGVDRFGHFEPEPVPAFDFAPDAVAFHAKAVGQLLEVAGASRGAKP